MSSPRNMPLARTTAVIIALMASASCSLTRQDTSHSSVSTSPFAAIVPVSPVDLRTAILTLPASAVAEMSERGRRDYLRSTPGVFDEEHRRIELFRDNPYEGGDSKSMLFLRLFEDADGHTIAASHAARPFADGTLPSPRFTHVYRLMDGAWIDITDEALPRGVSRESFFRFDQAGSRISFGSYIQQERADSRGNCYNFGKMIGTIDWRNGAFHENTKS